MTTILLSEPDEEFCRKLRAELVRAADAKIMAEDVPDLWQRLARKALRSIEVPETERAAIAEVEGLEHWYRMADGARKLGLAGFADEWDGSDDTISSDGIVYILVHDNHPGWVKVGFTLRSGGEKARAREYAKAHGFDNAWQAYWAMKTPSAAVIERRIHRMLAKRRVALPGSASAREIFEASAEEVVALLNAEVSKESDPAYVERQAGRLREKQKRTRAWTAAVSALVRASLAGSEAAFIRARDKEAWDQAWREAEVLNTQVDRANRLTVRQRKYGAILGGMLHRFLEPGSGEFLTNLTGGPATAATTSAVPQAR